MKISAKIENGDGEHHVTVTTNGITQAVEIPPKASGMGSSVNGGELLFLALATCYANDLYREAGKRGITVHRVEVEVEGRFGAEGEGASEVTYRAGVVADADEAEIESLMRHTDTVAEIQNTLRGSTPVTLTMAQAVSRRPGVSD